MIYVILYFLLLVFNIWFFLVRPKESLTDRITVLLQIIAVYTFAFGLLAQTGILRSLEVIASDMTSSDLNRFLSGNLIALSLMFSAESLGLSPDKIDIPLSHSLEFIILIFMSTASLFFTIFYLIVVLPLSYIAYVIVSVPVNAVISSARDITFSINGSEISIKNIVAQNTVTIKNMLVAIPSFFLSVTLKICQLYRNSLFGISPRKIRDWFSAHVRTANMLLLASQAILISIIIIHTITAITSIAFVSPLASNKSGELIGIVILNILIISVLILLYLRVNSFRKNTR